jgi:hypothetical protein
VYSLTAGLVTIVLLTIVLRTTGLRLTVRLCARTSVAPNAKNIAKSAVKILKLNKFFIVHLFLFVYKTKLKNVSAKVRVKTLCRFQPLPEKPLSGNSKTVWQKVLFSESNKSFSFRKIF